VTAIYSLLTSALNVKRQSACRALLYLRHFVALIIIAGDTTSNPEYFLVAPIRQRSAHYSILKRTGDASSVLRPVFLNLVHKKSSQHEFLLLAVQDCLHKSP
jgi:hypothetical protein